MSYDIDLRLPEYGPIDDRAALEELEGSPMSETERARNRGLVTRLREQTPELELHESDEAVELTDLRSGIQISLFAKSGAVSMPYWHEGNAAELLRQISKYLRLLHDEGGFLAYDPQTEREVDAATGYSLDPAVYAVGVDALRNVLTPAERKPWWRFW